jgi:drug/metabolite transporter (DMT)-like permease
MNLKGRNAGLAAALASAAFLGLAPVFGRGAIISGFSWLAVVALRTSIAAGMLLIIMLIFRRPFLYIFPIGLLGCVLAGTINGLGSLLYYRALESLNASVGQLIYSLYPLFVLIFSILDQQTISRLTFTRIGLAAVAVFLLAIGESNEVHLEGVILMLGSAMLYALHIPINQRVLFEIPAPTVTLYTLLAMSAVTGTAFYFSDQSLPAAGSTTGWGYLLGLTLVTFLSRITLFMGVKQIGGIQTALLGLGELFVTILLGHILLAERMTLLQWIGTIVLMISFFMIAFDKTPPTINRNKGGWLSWITSTPKLPPVNWN